MKVRGLNGREYQWKTGGLVPDGYESRPRSSYHRRARKLLRLLFPSDRIMEEVPLPGCRESLHGDFYLPMRNFMVEVHGEQHYKFIQFFHQDRNGFIQSLRCDQWKAEWCELNHIPLVVLPYNEEDDEWTRRILAVNRPSEEDGSGQNE